MPAAASETVVATAQTFRALVRRAATPSGTRDAVTLAAVARRRRGQYEAEAGPAVLAGLVAHPPAHGLDQPPDEGQPEPRAPAAVTVAAPERAQAREQRRDKGLGYAGTVVADDHFDLARVRAGLDEHRRRPVRQRVLDQVGDDLLEPAAVGQHAEVRRD